MSLRRTKKSCSKSNHQLKTIHEYEALKSEGYHPDNEENFGRILIDDSFNLQILHLFDCLFEFNRFYQKFAQIRKILSKILKKT